LLRCWHNRVIRPRRDSSFQLAVGIRVPLVSWFFPAARLIEFQSYCLRVAILLLEDHSLTVGAASARAARDRQLLVIPLYRPPGPLQYLRVAAVFAAVSISVVCVWSWLARRIAPLAASALWVVGNCLHPASSTYLAGWHGAVCTVAMVNAIFSGWPLACDYLLLHALLVRGNL